jgi:PAS domain S-box-containing protein
MSEPATASGTRPKRGQPAVWASYSAALVALVVAIAVRTVLTPWLGHALPFITIFGAVAVATWFGGALPAVWVTLLAYVALGFLLVEPTGGRFGFTELGDVVGLIAYLSTNAIIIVLADATRRARARERGGRELLRVTLKSIGDAVITTDNAGRVASMNVVAESLTGWTEADALGQPLDTVFRIVNEQSRQPTANPAARALREGVIVGLANHTILIAKDGRERHIDDSAAPIRDEFGHVSGCVLVFRDVSVQRQLEREQSERFDAARLLASIVESTDDAVIGKSLDGTILSWNAAAERLFGYPAADVVGRNITMIIPPDRISEEETIIANLAAGRRIEHFETERVAADGRRIAVSLTISPIRDQSGRVVGASKIVRDITEQRESQELLRKFMTLVEHSTDFIGLCDLQGIPFFVNRAGLAMVGLDDLDAARAMPVRSFFFPEDQARIMDEFFPSALARGHGEVEVRFRNFKTGEAHWMIYKVVVLPGAAGTPVAFATVSQEITARKQMEDELRRMAADLSEADRRKNEFLAMLAHELRNPLAPISNAARALRTGGRDEATLQAASGLLERQVAQMSRLVDDLLDMSRITLGKIALRKGRLELAPIVEQAVETVRGFAEAQGHELTVTLPRERILLDADPARLAQVIANLLHNACKFTDRGGHVWLTVEREDDEVAIRVKDNGIGIAPEHVPALFELFSQVDTSLERTRAGLGIGLTLVKSLVEMHGGAVTVHSEGPGRGTEFSVRLPIRAAETATAQPLLTPAPPAARRRVLIVDDSEDGAESLAMLLALDGHETHMVHDGLDALDAAERLRPDTVLLDIGLPRLNGYEVCRRLRQTPWGREMLLVALTGWGQHADRQRSTDAGFDAHLVKPVDYEELLRLLARPWTPPATHGPA